MSPKVSFNKRMRHFTRLTLYEKHVYFLIKRIEQKKKRYAFSYSSYTWNDARYIYIYIHKLFTVEHTYTYNLYVSPRTCPYTYVISRTAQKCRPCACDLSQCTRNAMHSRSPSLSANPSVGRATTALISDEGGSGGGNGCDCGCGGGDRKSATYTEYLYVCTRARAICKYTVGQNIRWGVNILDGALSFLIARNVFFSSRLKRKIHYRRYK